VVFKSKYFIVPYSVSRVLAVLKPVAGDHTSELEKSSKKTTV